MEGPAVHANEIVERYCAHFLNSAATEKRDLTLAKTFKSSRSESKVDPRDTQSLVKSHET